MVTVARRSTAAAAREHWSGLLDDFAATAMGCGEVFAGVAGGDERFLAALESAVVHFDALISLVGG